MKVLSLNSQDDFFHLPDRPQGGLCLALGFFNGLHLGHQELLQATCIKAKEEGWEPGVFLFRSSPGIRLGSKPELAGPHLLMLEEDRLCALEQAGFAWALVCDPSPSVLALPAKAFVEDFLLAGLGTKAVFCGEDFRFGYKAQGDVTFLASYAPTLLTCVFHMVKEAGVKLSSTQIRHELKEGRLDLAQRALGRPFGFSLSPSEAASLLVWQGLPLRLYLYQESDGKRWFQVKKAGKMEDREYLQGEGKRIILYPPDLTLIPEGAYEGKVLALGQGRVLKSNAYLALTQYLGAC